MNLDLAGLLAAEGGGLGSDLLRMLARDIPAVLIYGVIGIGMLILGFIVFDKVLPKLDFQVELGEKRNYALAIVLAAFLISVTVIIRGAIAPW
jgi:uncharacterized membrane protein YjfL (UPF0719 family)